MVLLADDNSNVTKTNKAASGIVVVFGCPNIMVTKNRDSKEEVVLSFQPRQEDVYDSGVH